MVASVCRVLLFSSLAFDTANEVTLEFATPRGTSAGDHGYAFCLTDAAFQQSADSVAVLALLEGGDQFAASEQLVASHNVSSAFRAPAQAWGLDWVSVASLHDVLGTDPYYGSSYRVFRCPKGRG